MLHAPVTVPELVPEVRMISTRNRVSFKPRAERTDQPLTRTVLREPLIRTPPVLSGLTTVTRPETPKGRTRRKALRLPIPYAAWSMFSNLRHLIDTDQVWFGFAETPSARSRTPRRYGIGAPPHTFSLFSVC